MGEFGAAPPHRPPSLPPPPNQAGSGSQEARRGLEREEAPSSSCRHRPGLREGPTSGGAQASLARAFSLSPPSQALAAWPPPSGCPKPRPGHAPKSRPRLWCGPLGREPNHKQNLQRPTRGWGEGARARTTRKGGCTVGNTRCGGAYRGRGIRQG